MSKERELSIRGYNRQIDKLEAQLAEANNRIHTLNTIEAEALVRWRNRAEKAEAQLEAVCKVSENGNLSWQDRHIAIWKIVHPKEEVPIRDIEEVINNE